MTNLIETLSNVNFHLDQTKSFLDCLKDNNNEYIRTIQQYSNTNFYYDEMKEDNNKSIVLKKNTIEKMIDMINELQKRNKINIHMIEDVCQRLKDSIIIYDDLIEKLRNEEENYNNRMKVVEKEFIELLKQMELDELKKHDEQRMKIVEKYEQMSTQFDFNYVNESQSYQLMQFNQTMEDSELLNELIKEEDNLFDVLEEKYQIQLQEWVGLLIEEIIFNSDIDNWTENSSTFNEKIMGKGKLYFIIEDEDNELFGYYLNTTIEKKDVFLSSEVFKADEESFHFNLESNGRLSGPMKFDTKIGRKSDYELFPDFSAELIHLGDIRLCKTKWKEQSYCCQNNKIFHYNGIQNALCGKQILKVLVEMILFQKE